MTSEPEHPWQGSPKRARAAPTVRQQVASYLRQVARGATDRPRALAASLLADALARPPAAEPAPMRYVEERVRALAAEDRDTAAEVVYELGSIVVELQQRFPASPDALTDTG